MRAVGYRVVTQARRQVGALLALILLVGVAGGVTLAAVGAARRTDSAFDRMVEATDASDVAVNPDQGTKSALTVSDLEALPMVERASRVDVALLLPKAAGSLEENYDSPAAVIPSDLGPHGIGRPVVHDGRLPDASDPNELFVQRYWAEEQGVQVGDHIDVIVPDPDVARGMLDEDPSEEAMATLVSSARPATLTVVGIGDDTSSIAYDEGFEPMPWMLTPAFFEKFGEPSAGYWAAEVRLRPGSDVESLRTALAGLAETFPPVISDDPSEPPAPEAFALQSLDGLRDKADRAIEPQVVALWAFAIVAGLVGALVVAQAVARRISADARDNSVLDAIGFVRRERAGSDLIRMAGVGVGGALAAMLIAWVASGLAPVGPARRAEPSPGLAFDGAVLAAGALAIALLVVVFALVPAWRAARVRHGSERVRGSVVASWWAQAGGRVTQVLGARFAFEPGPRDRAVPTRSTIIGACTAVGIVAASFTFGASLDHLVETPRLYGSPWTYLIDSDSEEGATVTQAIEASLAHNDLVEAWARVSVDEVEIGGHTIATVAAGGPKDRIQPVILDGTAPTTDDEVALGAQTMRQLGVGIGDTVAVGHDGSRLRVVGRTVLPGVGTYQAAEKTSLGEGALLTEGGLQRFGAGFHQVNEVIRTAAGVTADEVSSTMPTETFVQVQPVSTPSDVAALKSLRSTPVVLAAMLVGLLGLTLAHAMVLAVRRRRRDVAVLQMVGFRPGEVVRTTLWQATIVAVIGVVVGIPTGVALGRWAWVLLVERLGTVGEPVLPALALAATAAAVLVLANLVGIVPGWRAAHSAPALVLRTE